MLKSLPFWFYNGAAPTDFVVKYVGGARRLAGKGMTCVGGPRTTLALISTTDELIPFAFTERSEDGQSLVVQGELQIRLDPERLLERHDYSIDPRSGEYRSDDPDKVREEVTHVLQSIVRSFIKVLTLKEAPKDLAGLRDAVLGAVRSLPAAFTDLGVTVVNLFISGVEPANPDLKRALEAEARERLLADADRAIADRRMAAATSDRALKQYEAESALALETDRAKLVAAESGNAIARATADAEATRLRMAPYENVDATTLLALGIRELGAGKVGSVNFTPDFLAAVTSRVKADADKNGKGTV